MVAVKDRFSVWSKSLGRDVEGVVLAPKPNGYWLVQYDTGDIRTKSLNDWDIITTSPAVQTIESEEVLSEKFVAIVNGKITDFGQDELAANRFVVRALKLGETADVFVEKTVRSFHRVDPE
jgi:hypothetical protein